MKTQLFSINQTKDEITRAYAPVNLAGVDEFAIRLVKFRGEFERWHVHQHEDESFIVLEGEITVHIGADEYELGPGGFAFMPRNVPHAITVRTPTMRGMSVSAPGGVFDNIIRERSEARRKGIVLDVDELWAIREKYGMRRVQSLTEGLVLPAEGTGR